MSVTTVHSATGAGNLILVRNGEQLDYANTVAGGGDEVSYIERTSSGATWENVVPAMSATVATTRLQNDSGKDQYYRSRVEQVGGAFTGTHTIVLTDVVETIQGGSFTNNAGVEVAAVTETGMSVSALSAATLAVSGATTLAGNLSVAGTVAKTEIAGVRDSNTTGYENFLEVGGDITNTSAGAKTYGILVDMTRPTTSDTTGGDIDDAGIKVRVRNEADGNTAGNTLRGIDVQARNHDTAANMTNLSGGVISLQTDSGGTTGNCTALAVQTTLNGTVTDSHLPLDVRAFRQSAGVPTLEAIARFRNGATSGTGVATGILITSEAGAPAGIINVIDMSGATVTGADVVLSNGCKLYSGTAVTRAAVRAVVGDTPAIGSMFLSTAAVGTTKPNTYIKTANGAADTDWERLVTQASD